MAAYRQAKRMQRGALTAQGGFFTTDPALLQVPCTLRCVFVVTDILDKEQTVLDTSGGSYYPRIDIRKQADSSKYNTIIYIGGGAFYVNIELGTITEVAFSVAETEQIVYVNGELVGKKSYTSTSFTFISIGNFNRGKGNDFHGDIMLFQQFNYVLSADEIATLYNNGDPMGYVVPKAKRDGLLAEYLPQNLMYSKDDKTIATSWLDSAKQMPLSDEYIEPLFQSIGGYDMAANGAPEVLFKGQKVEIQSIANNTNGGVNYPGNFTTMGFCQSWIYPLIKGATYRLNYKGSVNKDIGSVYLCSLCKLDGDYVTLPRKGVGEKIFAWNNTDSINQGGEFKVPLETDKDCIVITGLRDTYDPNITIKLVKIE